jgi:hypothetical protein
MMPVVSFEVSPLLHPIGLKIRKADYSERPVVKGQSDTYLCTCLKIERMDTQAKLISSGSIDTQAKLISSGSIGFHSPSPKYTKTH